MTETPASFCYTAHSVSQVNERKIPVRVLSISNSTVELHTGEKIARFWPVVEPSLLAHLLLICVLVLAVTARLFLTHYLN